MDIAGSFARWRGESDVARRAMSSSSPAREWTAALRGGVVGGREGPAREGEAGSIIGLIDEILCRGDRDCQ